MDPGTQRIGFLLFNDCDLLDVTGPAAVFDAAARQLVMGGAAQETPIELVYLSPDGGAVSTRQSLSVHTRQVFRLSQGELDTVIVVGGTRMDVSVDERLVAWVRENHRAVRRLGSVCTGAFVLGRAGLLDGRRAVTHWEDCEALQRQFPDADVDPNCIFVEDSHVWTSAGVSAGIDMALAMIEQDYGHELALNIARRLVVFLKRPGGQSQFSSALRSQAVGGSLAPLLNWIADHPDADLRAEALAERANMSLRNFYRAFVDATGVSPAEWVEATRLEVAKRLLEQTSHHVDQVALKAGFGTYERMRRTFARRLSVSPAAYRDRFSKVLAAPAANIFLGSIDLAARRFEGAAAH